MWRRGIPTSPERVGPSKGKFCMDTKKSFICSNISQSTFPPAPEAWDKTPSQNPNCNANSEHQQEDKQMRSPFFPAAHSVMEALVKATSKAAQELIV